MVSQSRSGGNVAKKTNELRRDIEAILLTGQASVADNGDSTAGKTAGLAAWIETNASHGSGGSSGGFNTSTKVVDAPTNGEAQGLTMDGIRTQVENCYTAGSNPTVLTSVPAVTKAIGTFLLSSSGAPYRAAPTANVSGTSPAAQTAQGYVDVIVTDFNVTLKIVPNRLQQQYDDATTGTAISVADVFIVDPEFVCLSYLYGYKVEDLAKLGLSDRKQVSTDWMTKVFREDAHAIIRQVNPATAVAAS